MLLKKIILNLIYFFDLIIKKNKTSIVISSFPDFCHNALPIYFILSNNKNYKITWLLEKKENCNLFKEYVRNKNLTNLDKTKFVTKKSLFGLLSYLTSKYVFYTHGLYKGVKIPKNKVVINLWHGMPMKFNGLKHIKNDQFIQKFSYIFVTSSYFKKVFSEIFPIEHSKIIITGQPVTDIFSKKLKTNLIKTTFNILDANMIFIWTPTWKVHYKKNVHENNKFPVSEKKEIIPLIKNFQDLSKLILV